MSSASVTFPAQMSEFFNAHLGRNVSLDPPAEFDFRTKTSSDVSGDRSTPTCETRYDPRPSSTTRTGDVEKPDDFFRPTEDFTGEPFPTSLSTAHQGIKPLLDRVIDAEKHLSEGERVLTHIESLASYIPRHTDPALQAELTALRNAMFWEVMHGENSVSEYEKATLHAWHLAHGEAEKTIKGEPYSLKPNEAGRQFSRLAKVARADLVVARGPRWTRLRTGLERSPKKVSMGATRVEDGGSEVNNCM